MSVGYLALDPIAAELVSIAMAEYEAAGEAARAHLSRRLAPIKAAHCPEGELRLVPTENGWALEVDIPDTAPETLEVEE